MIRKCPKYDNNKCYRIIREMFERGVTESHNKQDILLGSLFFNLTVMYG